MSGRSLKWPKRLVIVRHGQSELNVAKDLLDEGLPETLTLLAGKRDVDVDLTQTGIWQAEQTGVFLANKEPFDICFSSPYRRAIRTAHIITSQFGYKIQLFKDNRIREKEFGTLHGLTTDDIERQFPHEYTARKREGRYWYRLPGGENYPDVEQRLHSFLDKLVRDWADKSVLVITHQVPYLMTRALFQHLDEDGVLVLGDVPNCGMQEYVPDTSKSPEGRMLLRSFNITAYHTVRKEEPAATQYTK